VKYLGHRNFRKSSKEQMSYQVGINHLSTGIGDAPSSFDLPQPLSDESSEHTSINQPSMQESLPSQSHGYTKLNRVKILREEGRQGLSGEPDRQLRSLLFLWLRVPSERLQTPTAIQNDQSPLGEMRKMIRLDDRLNPWQWCEHGYTRRKTP
jgi:hypothetical protein